jgi:cytochrome c oxidase subunit IV
MMASHAQSDAAHADTAHAGAAHAGGEHREESMVTYTVVFALLMILLIVTYVAYLCPLGVWNLPIALVIAVIKAAMVLMVFMHVRLSPKIVWVFAISSFLWLILMICGFENDYVARGLDGPYSHQWLNPQATAMVQSQ